ncbi:HSP20 family protein [Mucilaginibacter sp. OK268]|jgi:HSP20 family protein|uniref:Hsp20/alpha crystallin family protein n=1 Tax=Mucilaginibacter sp. OK268 TaxID=1881048 RepID=UPI00088A4383|nr:Hsp20/alpha crystallin family protein [Mucilaginibacter sp. OK268]SDP96974.1 HSP20 family protein [Mucilaginibacter sp. OK268]
MSTLAKTNGSTSLKSMMEDFWNTDGSIDKHFLSDEHLPAINIKEKEDTFELEVAAPGFKKDDFRISTENGLMTISAETSREKKEENESYTRREFSKTAFTRTFKLPENVQEEKIKASYKHGLLAIDLKKQIMFHQLKTR